METRYPIRKEDGKDFATLNEVLEQLSKEKHGQWLVGNNSMWHGGIHISPSSAPDSKIERQEDAASAIPLQCIAGGKVVACRLQDEYLEGHYGDATLQYSSAFLLVKSIHKPAADSKTWLTFYTLYMHLAPLSSHPKLPVYKVTERGNGLRMRKYQGDEAAGQEAPAILSGKILKTYEKVFVERQESFVIKGKNGVADRTEIFGLMLKVDDASTPENRFWASVRSEYVAPDGEAYAYLPKWMTTVIAQGGNNGSVFKPAEPFDIDAGEAVGFMARDDTPCSPDPSTDTVTWSVDWFSHIEVLSNDSNMPTFLNNPGALKTGNKYILIKPDQPLYQCEETGNARVYQPTGSITSAEAGQIIAAPESQTIAGVTWFKIRPDIWMNQSGVEQLTQHDLSKLKFTVLEQTATRNFQQTLDEAWISDAFRLLSESISPERDLECSSLCDYYSRMADVLDKNRDGKISAEEMAMYYQSVLQGVRSWNDEAGMLLRRLVVKHESEWFGGKDHPRWASLLEKVPGYGKPYLEKWLDDHEWMSQVPAFNNDNPVWHFHPVEFPSVIYSEDNEVKCSLCANGIQITPELLIHCYSISQESALLYAPLLTKSFIKYEINNCLRVSHFLGQVSVETKNLTKLREDLYYKDGNRLWNIYNTMLKSGLGRRFPEFSEVQMKQYTIDHLARNEDELAKTLFPSEYEGMDYRGRGLLHLTHEENYEKYKNYSGYDVVANPLLVESDPEIAVDSACWYWSIFVRLNTLADENKLSALTVKINAARLDMTKRGVIKEVAMKYIKNNNAGCLK